MQTPEERDNGRGKRRWSLQPNQYDGINEPSKSRTSFYICIYNFPIFVFVPAFDFIVVGRGRGRVTGKC